MSSLTVEILRDAANKPTEITIKKGNRTLKVEMIHSGGAVAGMKVSGSKTQEMLDLLNILYPRDVNVALTGSEYYDRNPTQIHKIYRGTLAPATGNRWTNTIPIDRNLMINYLQISVVRASAAAPVGIATAHVDLSGVAWTIAEIHSNTVGDRDDKIVRNTVIYGPDTIKGVTADASTGGTVTFTIYMLATEFDAYIG